MRKEMDMYVYRVIKARLKKPNIVGRTVLRLDDAHTAKFILESTELINGTPSLRSRRRYLKRR